MSASGERNKTDEELERGNDEKIKSLNDKIETRKRHLDDERRVRKQAEVELEKLTAQLEAATTLLRFHTGRQNEESYRGRYIGTQINTREYYESQGLPVPVVDCNCDEDHAEDEDMIEGMHVCRSNVKCRFRDLSPLIEQVEKRWSEKQGKKREERLRERRRGREDDETSRASLKENGCLQCNMCEESFPVEHSQQFLRHLDRHDDPGPRKGWWKFCIG